MKHFLLSLRLLFCIVAFSLAAESSNAQNAPITITGGLISVGADFATSPSMSTPPAGATSFDVFFDSDSFTSHPSGSFPMQGPAEGWAGAFWDVSGGNSPVIDVSGSSTQGFNGAITKGGFSYGFGHSAFTLDLTLNQAYTFTAVTPTIGASGITGNNGFLPAGNYILSGASYGKGGYNIDLKLTPASNGVVPESNSLMLFCGALVPFAGAAFFRRRRFQG